MKFWRRSLLAELVTYFLLFSLVTGSVGVYIAYTQAKRALEQSVLDRLAAAATLKEQALTRWVDDQRQVVESIVALPTVRENAALFLDHVNAGASVDALVNAASFSPDGRWLATTGIDKTLRVWDLATGEQHRRIENETALGNVKFSPDGRLLLASTADFAVRLWDAESAQPLARMAHGDQISDFAFSPSGQHIATASKDGTVAIWETTSGQRLRELQVMEEGGFVNQVVFSPDGQRLATASDNYLGQVWDAASGDEIARIEHDGWVFSAAFSPDGRAVATGGEDRTVFVWEATTGREIARVEHDDWINDIAFSPDGEALATAGDDHMVYLWNPETGERIGALEQINPLSEIAFSSDGKWLATLERDINRALVWAWETGELAAELVHNDNLSGMALSSDGQRIATTSLDGSARVWAIDGSSDGGEELERFEHNSLPYALLARSLMALTGSKADVLSVSILDAAGQVILSTDRAQEGTRVADVEPSAARAMGVVTGAQQPDAAVVQSLHASPAGTPTITISAPLRQSNGELGGVMMARLNVERMDAILSERTGLGRSGITYVVNRKGRFATASGFGLSNFPANMHSQGIDAAIAGNDGTGLYMNYAGVPVVGVYRWLDDLDVALLAELNQSEASQAARQLALSMLLAGLVLAAVITVGVILLARHITRPILAIAEAAGNLGNASFEHGDLVRIARREDEVGLLTRAFQKMASQVHAREQRLKQHVQELRVEIDQVKRERHVNEITESDYFQELQDKAKQLRSRMSDRSPGEA